MNRLVTTTVLLVLAVCPPVFAAETNDVLMQIERMASLGEKAERSLVESVADGIEKNPAQVSKAVVVKLNDKNLTEQQLAVYVWVLGLTRDQTTASVIKALHKQSKSDQVKGICLHALANIGGKQAGEFLLSVLDATSDKEMRFNILNLLAQMQYEPALPKAEEMLKDNLSIFFFGKMGDKAVPFLVQRISDKDDNIRANVINILGEWLTPPEAAKPLQDQFWVEKNAKLRGVILSSMEIIISDLAQQKVFFEQVVANEKDAKLVQFARETLNNLDQARANMASFAQKKQPSAVAFEIEYANIFKSAGKKGNYQTLEISSTAKDEPKLKALRERILQRSSDEALNDYQKVRKIINRNRTIAAMADQKSVQP